MNAQFGDSAAENPYHRRVIGRAERCVCLRDFFCQDVERARRDVRRIIW